MTKYTAKLLEETKKIENDDFFEKEEKLKDLFPKDLPTNHFQGVINWHNRQQNTENQFSFADYSTDEGRIKVIERTLTRNNLREKMVNYYANLSKNHPLNLAFEDQADGMRFLYSLNPEDPDNHPFLDDLLDDDPIKSHDAVMDLLDEMTNFDMSAVNNYTDEEFVAHFEEFFSKVNQYNGLEALKEFCHNQGNLLSNAEIRLLNDIQTRYKEYYEEICNRADTISNFYYPMVDLSNADPTNPHVKNALSQMKTEMAADDEATSFLELMDLQMSKKADSITNQIFNRLKANNDIQHLANLHLAPEPSDGEFSSSYGENFNYMQGLDYIRDLQEGKVIYAYGDSNNEEVPNVYAFKMNQHGTVYEVPCPIEQPGRLAYFWDGFLRFFGREGYGPVREYERRELEIRNADTQNRLRRPEKTLAETKGLLQRNKENIQAIRQMPNNDDDTLLSISFNLSSLEEKKSHSKDILLEVYGPNAKIDNVLLNRNAYTKGNFYPSVLPAPVGCPFNEYQTALIYTCGLTDSSLFTNYPESIKGLTDTENADRAFTKTVTDLLTTQRSTVFAGLDLINPGREKGRQALLSYMNGDKSPLAKALGRTAESFIKSVVSGGISPTGCLEIQYAKDLVSILESDPDLMKKSGFSKEMANKLNALDVYCDLYVESLQAKEKLLKEPKKELTLTNEERQAAYLSIASFETMKETFQNSRNALTKRPDMAALDERITNVNLQTGNLQISKTNLQMELQNPESLSAQEKTQKENDLERINQAFEEASDTGQTLFHKRLAAQMNMDLPPLFKLFGMNSNKENTISVFKGTVKETSNFSKIINRPPQKATNAIFSETLGKTMLGQVLNNVVNLEKAVSEEPDVISTDIVKSNEIVVE